MLRRCVCAERPIARIAGWKLASVVGARIQERACCRAFAEGQERPAPTGAVAGGFRVSCSGAGKGSRQDRYTSVSRLPLVPSRQWRVADHGEVVPYRAEIRCAEQLTYRRLLRGEGLPGAKRA